MSDSHLEDTLRARLHAAIDPHVPGDAAESRVLASVANAGRERAGERVFGLPVGPRLATGIAAAMAVLVVGGALTLSLALRGGTARGNPAPASGPPVIVPSPSPSPTPQPSPVPSPSPSTFGIQPCTGTMLGARLFDQDGAAGTLGGDIALRNTGTRPCTLEGYVNLQGVVGGRVVQLGVTHSADGPLLNNSNGTLPTVRLITLRPGEEAFVAYEDSDVPNGPTPCSATETLLIIPPQSGSHVSMSGTPIPLCGAFRAALWIDIAPVSTTPYYATRSH